MCTFTHACNDLFEEMVNQYGYNCFPAVSMQFCYVVLKCSPPLDCHFFDNLLMEIEKGFLSYHETGCFGR